MIVLPKYKDLLNEIAIDKKYEIERVNGKTNLDYKNYEQICLLDPTSKNGNAGKFSNWLLQQVDPNVLQNNEYRCSISSALAQFADAARRGILQQNGINPDINKFQDINAFIETMKNFSEQNNQMSQSEYNNRKKLEGQYEIVGESQNWYVVKPLTFEAERYFGGGTEWCTVADEYHFERYTKTDPLFITIPKNDIRSKKRMQFHFNNKQFGDVYDNVLKNPKYCISKLVGDKTETFYEICNMWDKIDNRFSEYRYIAYNDVPALLEKGVNLHKIFDSVGEFNSPAKLHGRDDGFYTDSTFTVVNLGGKINYVIREKKMLVFNKYHLLSPNLWFDYATYERGIYFKVGLGKVNSYLKYNYIRLDGTFVWDKPINQWFDYMCLSSNEDLFRVRYGDLLKDSQNCKTNFLRPDGTLIWNKPVNLWFKEIYAFVNGYATAYSINKDDEWYYLRKDGVLLDYKTKRPIEIDGLNESNYKGRILEKMMEPLKQKRIYLTENQVEEIKRFLDQARWDTNTHATEKQKKAGNYKHGRVRIHGFEIALENPKGSYRTGKDKNGREWKIKMQNDYGYFTRTLGKDGDAVDVFIGPNLASETIYCVDQKLGGKFDETKVMMGFNSAEQAKAAYLANYEENWKGFWKITAVSLKVFKEWLYDGYRQRKPFFEYVDIKKKKLNESKF